LCCEGPRVGLHVNLPTARVNFGGPIWIFRPAHNSFPLRLSAIRGMVSSSLVARWAAPLRAQCSHGIVTTNTVSIRTASQTMFATQLERDLDTAACRTKTAISLVGRKTKAHAKTS
jgi:hypothetical protein